MGDVEVDASDAIRLILQFLKENGLIHAMRALQGEAQISLNAVDSLDAFTSDIVHGRWDAVLQQTQSLEFESAAMVNLYEQIVLELLEVHEKDVVWRLLRTSPPMTHLQSSNPDRYSRLEELAKRGVFDSNVAYGGLSKQDRRNALAERFRGDLVEAPPSRLVTLLGQALKWQHFQGITSADSSLLAGTPSKVSRDKTDRVVRKSAGKIKFGKASTPQSAQFSCDGRFLSSGTKDGFVEVWDYDKCKLRKDLEYQAKDEFMMLDGGVTSQAYHSNGDLLATGSEGGQLKVWKTSTGVCLRRFDTAHNKSINSVCFSSDGTQVLTASFDHLVRIHGLKSGQMLKEFQGHHSSVNQAIYSKDGGRVISAGADGTIKVWNSKTTECMQTIHPPCPSQGEEVDVLCIALVPNGSGEGILVCARTSAMYLLSLDGDLLLTYKSDANNESQIGSFVSCAVSPRAKLVYGVTDTGYMLSFKLESAKLEETLQVSKGAAVGLTHHPYRNLLATFGNDGYIRLWKA